MAQILDSLGNAIYPVASIGYFASIGIRHTAADAATSVVFAMRNPAASTKRVCIKSITGIMGFDGTAAAAATLAYEFIRFTTGDPTTGATIARVRKRTTSAVSQILDANAQQKSGVLTVTGIAGIEVFATIRMPASVTNGIAPFDIDPVKAGAEYEAFELAAGEGLGIRLLTAAIIGLELSGVVEWEERT